MNASRRQLLRQAPLLLAFGIFAFCTGTCLADESAQIVEALRTLDANVLQGDEAKSLREMWPNDVRRRRQAANERSIADWRSVQSLEDWKRYREEKMERLAASLGNIAPPSELKIHITASHSADSLRVHNILFNSRPGLWISANLYEPATDDKSDVAERTRPGILICHSHHTPKTHGELQDMGQMWASRGCVVLVMDQIGHGERRTHTFASEEDFPQSFRVSRQDYYFRYDNGIQFHLAGESLIGQIVYDLRRGVDLLLSRPDVDPQKIVLLGSVAGGGDPVAVTAALDKRIKVVAPFNFGGPQPETRFPLPADAELAFNYLGGGSWESTRNLRRSAADGFAPWAIVGSVAPRGLIYAHEFAWDREHDPVWRRLQQIYAWHSDSDASNDTTRLDWVHGYGNVRLSSQEASHCTHIGRHHRERIHQALQRWCGINNVVDDGNWPRRDTKELLAWTEAMRTELQPQPLRAVLLDAANTKRLSRNASSPNDEASSPPAASKAKLRTTLKSLLGSIEPQPVRIVQRRTESWESSEVEYEFLQLETATGITLPTILLKPKSSSHANRSPVALFVSQSGKADLLRAKSKQIGGLLQRGIAVALCDLRGVGETSPDSGRERQSYATSLSSSELMLGETTVGLRLSDARSILRWLQSRDDLNSSQMAICGVSLAPTNSAEATLAVPRGIDDRPLQSEPLGGLLALLIALYEDSVDAVYIEGGLSHFASVLDSPYVTIPHDVVVPGLLASTDLPEIAGAFGDTPIAVHRLVDGGNRLATEDSSRTIYTAAKASPQWLDDTSNVAEWIFTKLNRPTP
ncbi:MAG: acetylxylan esterase [Planctomycetales bacterium]|nr:acetylxylan esterase [Planctomycetales bacterium]